MTLAEHTTKAFDVDLRALTQLVAEMGGWAERQVVKSIDALIHRDRVLAAHLVATDSTLDAFQLRIEERAIATIATRQPVAVDLRDIVGILRIAGELERIGDLAKNIAKRALSLSGQQVPRRAVGGMRHMADLAVAQLHDVLDSFAGRDCATALTVRSRDGEIDAMYASLFGELLTYMQEDPGTVAAGTHLLFCAKNLERIGDHTIVIAQAVQYMVEGRGFREQRPEASPPRSLATSVLAPPRPWLGQPA